MSVDKDLDLSRFTAFVPDRSHGKAEARYTGDFLFFRKRAWRMLDGWARVSVLVHEEARQVILLKARKGRKVTRTASALIISGVRRLPLHVGEIDATLETHPKNGEVMILLTERKGGAQ
jgi:hypothetical protein